MGKPRAKNPNEYTISRMFDMSLSIVAAPSSPEGEDPLELFHIVIKLLNLAKEKNDNLNGWVASHDNYLKKDGSNYKAPLACYIKNGFV